MSFDTQERSIQGGRPVELYTFAREGATWRYTSGDRDVVLLGNTYAARALRRSDIESTNEKARLGLRITAPRFLEVADLYRVAPPTQAVTLVLQQYHAGDGEVATLWTGRILSVLFQGLQAEIALEPLYTSIRRIGLRRLYQRQCAHVLYGPACRVVRTGFRVDGTVASVSGQVVNVSAASAYAAQHFAGGYLEFAAAAGVTERRFILEHSGAALTLSSGASDLAPGAAVSVFPGCDHTIATCTSKFSNAANFGGFPYFPTKNPFDGSPVY